jgi:hypothetical protein
MDIMRSCNRLSGRRGHRLGWGEEEAVHDIELYTEAEGENGRTIYDENLLHVSII